MKEFYNDTPETYGVLFGTETFPAQQTASTLLAALWRSDNHVHQLGTLDKRNKRFRNFPVDSIKAGVKLAIRSSSDGIDTYFACAEFKTGESRKADNVAQAWAFWLDIDCGLDKAATDAGYLDVGTAKDVLATFCAATNLPNPTHVVLSGNGVHVYWACDKPIEAQTWKQHAAQLKALTEFHGLRADPTRTADIASVLRVPGTLNFKASVPRSVVLDSECPALDRDGLLQAITHAHAQVEVTVVKSSGTLTRSAKPIDKTVASTYGPPDLQQLKDALKALDPDCDEKTWKLYRLAPLAAEARKWPDLADDLKQLAKDWSNGQLRGHPSLAWSTERNGVTGAVAFDQQWHRFLNEDAANRVTIGTIFFAAQQAGSLQSKPSEMDMAIGNVETPAAMLAGPETPPDELQQARDCISGMLEKLKGGDIGAPFEEGCIAALSYLRTKALADYQRIRSELKTTNKQVSLTELDNAVKAKTKFKAAEAPTHHGYASAMIGSLTVNGWAPVGHEGRMFVVDPVSHLWVPLESGALEKEVAEHHDNSENCTRKADYSAIAQHAVSLAGAPDFFANAAVGLACPSGFHRVHSGKAIVEPLTPDHRQRVSLDFDPREQATPLFDAFLHQTFKSDVEEEGQEQIALVQEIAGTVMLGLMARYHKAVLFTDPYGRAGKGTLMSILSRLVPSTFTTAVSPFSWDNEYYLIDLAGSRLNVVGELPEDKSIPAAIFKSVIGGDLLSGRHPAGRVIKFRNGASHIFMSNHLIQSRDQSEAFFGRWLIVEFPNSLTRSGLQPDPDIASRIIDNEMPGIAAWALVGATRLLRNGQFSASKVNDRQKQKWRRGNSSLDEFIYESCDLVTSSYIRRAELYMHYKTWCVENGRKPFAKSRVKELLEHNIGLRISLASLDGYEIFRGVKLKPDHQLLETHDL